jgi:hypothetical protein
MELTVKFSQAEMAYNRPRPGDPLPNINNYPILATTGVEAGAEANMVSTYVSLFFPLIYYSICLLSG